MNSITLISVERVIDNLVKSNFILLLLLLLYILYFI